MEELTGDAQVFIEKIWGRRVHLHRMESPARSEVLTLADVDGLITTAALRTPALRVIQDGKVLPANVFTRSASIAGVALTGLVDPRRVLDLFDGGATLVLQGLQRFWPPITELVRELEDALGHPCQANAYLTPPGAQGFSSHRDTHDVFVLQTHGVKQWQIGDCASDERGEHSVLLEAGLALYLPTGTPHAARADRGASLHVTIGVNRISWREAVSRAVQAGLADPEWDEPLPAGYHRDPRALSALMTERIAALARRITTADSDAVASQEITRFFTTRSTAARGGLMDRVELPTLSDTTAVRRRPGSTFATRTAGDRIRVLLGDRELRMPGWLLPALEVIGAAATIRPVDLSALLDESSRLVLIRRLIREGLLEIDR